MYPLSPQHVSPARRRLGLVLTATTVMLTAVVPSAATAAPAAPAVTGKLIQLHSLGGQGSFATDMNDRGDTIGSSVDAADNYRAVVWWRGQRSPTALGIAGASPVTINEKGHIAGYADTGLFLWRGGRVTYLKLKPETSVEALLLNDRDQITGTVTDQNGAGRAFLWQRGRMTMLPTPKGMDSRATGLNNRGQVIGTVTRSGDATGQAVLWQRGRMVRLGTLGGAGSTPTAINDRGQVGGTSAVAGSPAERPFLWQRGRMTDLLAGTSATTGQVSDLNEAGMMTGTVTFGNRDSRPVLWRAGRMTDIGLPGQVGRGTDINERGDVTGYTWPDPESTSVAFRWRQGQTTVFPEPAADIAITVIGIDRRGVVGVDLETSRYGNIVLRSA